MNYYNINNDTNQKNKIINTMLYMSFSQEIGDSFGNELPYPQKHFINYSKINGKISSYVYVWELDGYFNTKNNYMYLNDIIARMMITFSDLKVEKLKHFKVESKNYGIKLKDFQNLKSMISQKVNSFKSTESVNIVDQVFWSLKLFVEMYIENNGNFISYSTLEDFAFNNFLDHTKDKSTLKVKCRNIWNYYNNRDFELQLKYQRKLTDKELKMSRSENIKKVNEKQKENNKERIENLLTGIHSHKYKKVNGKWNTSKIGKELGISRQTISKHLKEIEL